MRGRLTSLAIVVVLFCAGAFSQECPKATLDKVLGQTCTIGPLTFTFRNGLSAWNEVLDLTTGQYVSTPILSKLKFKPLVAGKKVGFEISGFPDAVADGNQVAQSYIDDFTYYIQGNTPVYTTRIHLRDYALVSEASGPQGGSESFLIARSSIYGAAPDPFIYYGTDYDWQLSISGAEYDQKSQSSIPPGSANLSIFTKIELYAAKNAQAQSDGAQFWYTLEAPKNNTD